MKDILSQWIQQGLTLKVGEEIYIPTAHKNERKDFFVELRQALKRYREIDPVGGSQIRLIMTVKDGKYYVVMKKVGTSPLVGYKKDLNGVVTKLVIQSKELERIERLKLLDEKGE